MAAFHSTAKWQRLRLTILTRDLWTCQMCGVMLIEGRASKASAVVDHLKPHTLRPELVYADTNLWSVCKGCHDGACASIEFGCKDADQIEQLKRTHHRGGYSKAGRARSRCLQYTGDVSAVCNNGDWRWDGNRLPA